jgi:hypothetical protein
LDTSLPPQLRSTWSSPEHLVDAFLQWLKINASAVYRHLESTILPKDGSDAFDSYCRPYAQATFLVNNLDRKILLDSFISHMQGAPITFNMASAINIDRNTASWDAISPIIADRLRNYNVSRVFGSITTATAISASTSLPRATDSKQSTRRGPTWTDETGREWAVCYVCGGQHKHNSCSNPSHPLASRSTPKPAAPPPAKAPAAKGHRSTPVSKPAAAAAAIAPAAAPTQQTN